jgi:Xaa-Pro dipeptidase
VVEAQRAVMVAMRPGFSWSECHVIATRKVLEALVSVGILKGEVDEMVKAKLGPTFLPCGLGHFIGGSALGLFYCLELSPSSSPSGMISS